MKPNISIIGCGWLGLPLAAYLVKKGYNIKGSTTSKQKLVLLAKHHIQPYVLTLHEQGITGDFNGLLSGSEIAIINIPPGLRKQPNKDHVKEIENLLKAIDTSAIKKIIYISSTSVFKDTVDFPVITAQQKPNSTDGKAKQLIAIEQLLSHRSNFDTTILRFGGLFDEERHPAKYLSGRSHISNPEAPINLIHKNDCIHIIARLIEYDLFNTVLNAVYPQHPTKMDYYITYCESNNLEVPAFNTTQKSKGKIVESSKLVQLLDYTFQKAP
ncbi:MAG: NAD(P)H-binding protein [Winogradskyella sp.]|nr:NAD(P)H-binding protein [Winogradskyella sp.]